MSELLYLNQTFIDCVFNQFTHFGKKYAKLPTGYGKISDLITILQNFNILLDVSNVIASSNVYNLCVEAEM